MRGPLDNGPMSTCLHVPINVHRHFFFLSFSYSLSRKFVTDIKREKKKKRNEEKEVKINRASIAQAIRKWMEREG